MTMSDHDETARGDWQARSEDREREHRARQEARVEERHARQQARAEERRERRERTRRGRERHRNRGGKENVVTCRLDDETLDALDTLVEAGVRSTRSDAAAWLIRVGLEVNHELLDEVSGTVTEIRRLRDDVVHKAKRFTGVDPTTDQSDTADEPEDSDGDEDRRSTS